MRVIFIFLFYVCCVVALCNEITLWTPGTEYQFPTLTFQQQTLVSGEVKAEKPIKSITVEMVSKKPEQKQSFPCSLYFEESSAKKQAVFKTMAMIQAPMSLLNVIVLYEDQSTFEKIFPLKMAYKIAQYESFGLLLKASPHTQAIASINFTYDNEYLVTASDDNKACLIDPATLKVIKSFRHPFPVSRAFLTRDKKLLVTSCKDKAIRVWDVSTEKEIHKFTGHDYPVYALALSPDNKYIASACRKIIMWNLPERKKISEWPTNYRKIFHLLFSGDGRYLFSTDELGLVKIWNPADGYMKYERGVPYGEESACMTISSDTRFLYTGNIRGAIRCWQLILDPSVESWNNDGRKMWERRILFIKSSYHDPARYAYTDFSKYFDKVKNHSFCTITDRDKFEVDAPYSSFTQGGGIVGLELNNSGEFLMLATRDGEMRIHETFTAVCRYEVILNKNLQSATFAENGAFVALGGAKGEIFVYGFKP
ncbi:MAG: hypothetical protein HUU50_03205 [Candidatus Brocadiae bacterium]|nr:hypothetical protein [Candidatus Brocadiia bacterium]